MFRIVTWMGCAAATLILADASTAVGQTPAGVDHYVCHLAVDAKVPVQPKFPKEVSPDDVIAVPFEDAFTPLLGATPLYDMSRYARLCVPSRKIHPPNDFAIGFPDVHLADLQVKLASKLPNGEKIDPKQPKFPKGTIVRVIDQFHDQQVEIQKASSVLVRASKVDFGPPVKCKTSGDCPSGTICQPLDKPKTCLPPEPPVAPAPANDVGVHNFTCYQVKAQGEAPSVLAVQLENQFTEAIAGGPLRYDIKKITRFCAPANKAGENPGAPNHFGHLACYQAKLASKLADGTKIDPKQPKFGSRKVSIATVNFGERFLDLQAESEICVPAFRNVVGPTPTPSPGVTTTPTPSPSPSRTPTPTPSPSPTPAPTASASPSPAPSASPSPSPSVPPTCTTVSITVNVNYNTSDFPQVSGLQMALAYPTSVSIPQSGNHADVRARVTKLNPTNGTFLVSDNDSPPATANVSAGLIAIPGPIPPGPFVRVQFDCATGTTPSLGQFQCTHSGSTSQGNPVTTSCALSMSVP